jgi:hypothetical protein
VPGAAVDWEFHTTAPAIRRGPRGWRRSALARLGALEPAPERGREARGLVGCLTLEGDVSPFAPLLRAAEVLHAGKGAVFGLGKVEVKPRICRDLPCDVALFPYPSQLTLICRVVVLSVAIYQ